jgi:hypothetical protein
LTVVAGTLGCTTSTHGTQTTPPTGTKSFSLNGTFACIRGLAISAGDMKLHV